MRRTLARMRPPVVRLYDSHIPSGNAHKVQLVLHQLEYPEYETVSLDILNAGTRTPEFLAKNPNGRIPTVELKDGTHLAESNAIICYLAEGTPMFPDEPVARAQTLQWLFFEQYSHERFVAVLKFWTYWGGLESKTAEIPVWKAGGQAAIDVMETHLEGKTFFVAERYTVADVALFAYTRSAEDVGFQVGPNVRAWLARVQSLPRYLPPKKDPLGKCPTEK